MTRAAARRAATLLAWSARRAAASWAGLTDLVLPAECAGCRATGLPLRYGVCPACVTALEALRPGPAMPVPPPPGLPPCVALGEYGGVLREALLAYKERGRHGLGRPLGGLLAECVAAAVEGGSRVLLVPVPTTAKAIRARHGDHARRLARQAAARLRRAGVRAEVAQPLRALPRPDSAGLDAATRAAVAAGAIKLRPARAAAVVRSSAGTAVVLVDDIVTTGATLAAAATTLRAAGIRVRAAVVLAATRRRVPSIPG